MIDKLAKECLEENLALLNEYSDETHRLVVDNPDWDRISKALVGWDIAAQLVPDEANVANSLRCLTEIIYIMGYNCGVRRAGMPDFVVAPETEKGE